MKIFLDFLPIILFFAAFKFAEGRPQDAAAFATDHFGFMVSGGVVGAGEAPVLLATVVVIAATLLQVLYLKVRRQKIDTMLWVSLALVTVLGGATIWFHNETFIKWKPTLLYWALGAGLLVSQGLFRKNPVRALVGANLTLPDPVWSRLNLAWGVFFVALGVLNLWVAYAFSTSTWATFKVFGATGIMLLFMIAQGVYMSRYLPEEEAPAAEAPEAAAPAAAAAEKKHGVTAQDIESALRTALAPAALEVQDDSHLHAGHAGAREGRHFTVRIVSERFAGLNRVARHRLVYDALHELIPQGIHALAIQADTPERSPVHQS
jgi:intracellular septation protein